MSETVELRATVELLAARVWRRDAVLAMSRGAAANAADTAETAASTNH